MRPRLRNLSCSWCIIRTSCAISGFPSIKYNRDSIAQSLHPTEDPPCAGGLCLEAVNGHSTPEMKPAADIKTSPRFQNSVFVQLQSTVYAQCHRHVVGIIQCPSSPFLAKRMLKGYRIVHRARCIHRCSECPIGPANQSHVPSLHFTSLISPHHRYSLLAHLRRTATAEQRRRPAYHLHSSVNVWIWSVPAIMSILLPPCIRPR